MSDKLRGSGSNRWERMVAGPGLESQGGRDWSLRTGKQEPGEAEGMAVTGQVRRKAWWPEREALE